MASRAMRRYSSLSNTRFLGPPWFQYGSAPMGLIGAIFNVYVDDELRAAGHNYSPLPGIHPAELSTQVTMPAGTHTIRLTFTGGRSMYPDKLVYTAHTPTAPTYLPQTLTHAARVAAAGGEGVDFRAVDAAYTALLARNALSAVLTWTDPAFGYVRNGERVVRLFSLNGEAGDAVLMAGSNGPKLLPRSFHGYRAELLYNGIDTMLHIPNMALAPTGEYALLSVSQSPAGTDSRHLGLQINSTSFIGLSILYGYPRFTHAVHYTGAESYLADSPSGNPSNYNGAHLRVAVRFQAGRTNPSEIISRSLGVDATGYVYNHPRGGFSTIASFMLGGYSVYNSLFAGTNVHVNTVCVLSTENAAAVDLLDQYLKRHYVMLSCIVPG